jgi:hypothetical protein
MAFLVHGLTVLSMAAIGGQKRWNPFNAHDWCVNAMGAVCIDFMIAVMLAAASSSEASYVLLVRSIHS